jgi:hypothetical protein
MMGAYSVIRAFKATSPISGLERQFKPSDTLICETGQDGATVTFEFDQAFYLVELLTFKSCCVWKNEGTGPW